MAVVVEASALCWGFFCVIMILVLREVFIGTTTFMVVFYLLYSLRNDNISKDTGKTVVFLINSRFPGFLVGVFVLQKIKTFLIKALTIYSTCTIIYIESKR